MTHNMYALKPVVDQRENINTSLYLQVKVSAIYWSDFNTLLQCVYLNRCISLVIYGTKSYSFAAVATAGAGGAGAGGGLSCATGAAALYWRADLYRPTNPLLIFHCDISQRSTMLRKEKNVK